MDDMMPEAVVFSVDFFNAFYIATSMQNASSTATVVIIMVVDLFHTFYALKNLQRRASSIMKKLHEDDQKLLDVAYLLLRTQKLESINIAHIQIHSWVDFTFEFDWV
ncbi:uncharacterized protein PITG_15313 [Phytophthora infestans T30-4]|uniref:Uncharacterized protein n=1 Tax=Phytophthora infestans (strain T30-4) TaxID=403677 RepID=D0NQE8_PHYIT|nr:uncharacterized protein PITG_15313 [Phytophthora infestans T30-4]EEY62880.1 hypothetical protein PITG_15313 [Phytophthora infestans T30-4]|eukprot:XP_002898755.1 hypothetical protein PITG_15313 [Phytophthora infestans T30-4]